MVERTADQRIRTTEWEDIQYKHGNRVGQYAANELGILAQKIAEANVNTCLKAYDPHEERVRDKMERGGYGTEQKEEESGMDHLLVGEGNDDDDEALAAFRRKRLAELKQQQEAQRFGVLRHISSGDYMAEVTEASSTHWVVALLIKPGNNDCERLLSVMKVAAQRHRDVKFLSMISTETIKNFPDRHLPCVLLYKNKQLQQQFTELTSWTSKRKELSLESVERVLHLYGVIHKEEFDVEEEEF
ncbi:phosducin [Trypanosoma melophagium]|uniref:phosducin n=1 Tax=Trypanosoma melophagium TaxID=715481 RepID=UPI00351A42F7|nr:phosducin [Trypanosoma melophagium]